LQEDIITLRNKGSVTVSQKKGEEGARRNAGIKWGITYHIQGTRSNVQINTSFPFKLKLN